MIPDLLNLTAVEGASMVTLAQSASDGSAWWLLFLGPAGGVAFYALMYGYYRNANKSHNFEHETLITAQPVTGDDVKIREIRGTRKTRIDGENRTNHRQRVQRG